MPTRRHIVVILDQDENGRMVEINRAWQYDEFTREDGSIGRSPDINVTADTLDRLLPDRPEMLGQIAVAHTARDAARAEVAAATRSAVEAIEQARTECEDAVATAKASAEAAVAAAVQEREAVVQSRLVAEAAAARAQEELRAQVESATSALRQAETQRDALAEQLRQIQEPETFAAAYVKQVLADRGLLDAANAFAEQQGMSRVWLDAGRIRVTTPLIVAGLAALGIEPTLFWVDVRALRDRVQ